AEGDSHTLEAFLRALRDEKPPAASIESVETSEIPPLGERDFVILESEHAGAVSALVPPDLATCADCLRELFDPADRRHLYPFINCTNCGPRYSILRALPYDRPNTTMAAFAMCDRCRAEYEDPLDRRFHAQPNACPVCGPRLELWDESGHRIASEQEALLRAAEEIRRGRIVALKGVGGFQLLADARNDEAVRRLRARKRREEKPFALMAPSMKWIEETCATGEAERALLLSPQAPITLLRRRSAEESAFSGPALSPSVAPGNPNLGVMLPYSPLHHVLMRELGFPIVATSGNLSEEPICIDEREAVERLGGIADAYLVHNRPIERPMDDSVVRVVFGEEQAFRRARGYAPFPVTLPRPIAPMIAVGGHLKNTVALSVENRILLSQHVGDLETKLAHDAFLRALDDLTRLYDAEPSRAVCDLHPDYLSTRHAERMGLPVARVQHHVAHVMACMAEHRLEPPLLGVAWDGIGYGEDGTAWGGEFFRVTDEGCRRAAHLRAFRLPGGEAAVREPRRCALGALYEVFGERAFEYADLPTLQAFSAAERAALRQMLARGLNSPFTSSAGRLFDAVSSLLGLCQKSSFEGQAAMRLEFAIEEGVDGEYPFAFLENECRESRLQAESMGAGIGSTRDIPPKGGTPYKVRSATFRSYETPEEPYDLKVALRTQGDAEPWRIDWAEMIEGVLADLRRGEPVGRIAARFHNTLAIIIVEIARQMGERRVALTGGCFQNRRLLESTVQSLRAEGFQVFWPQRLPCNDGGIAAGQIWAAARRAPESDLLAI
ncbi:MAG: carbamoyltransferase HypF, partial [Candidatus Sumerlaeota bacterium]|nr:carbamoyltransferase HypF [Candidatus Sumerlaeota bacterium]